MGELQSLTRDGRYAWEAMGIECRDAEGRTLARLGVSRLADDYALPPGTSQATLWIGPALGGADWWKRWDCQPADADPPEIALAIRPVPRQGPRPTDCDCAVPTPRP